MEEYIERDFIYRLRYVLHMKYIGRDQNGKVMAYNRKPKKVNLRWVADGAVFKDKFPIMAEYEFLKNIRWDDEEPFDMNNLQ